MLKDYLEGSILDNLPNKLIRTIGQEIGKLHQIPAPDYLPTTLNYGVKYFDEVKQYAADSIFYKWLMEKQKYISEYFSPNLPKALIHSDIFSSNIIVTNDNSHGTIMDFEEACNYYRVFDIGMTIVGLCREKERINLYKAQSLLKGYNEEITLLSEEIKCLKASVIYAATAMCFWRHKNFNYVNPTPSHFDHYKELQMVADHVFGLEEDCFVELMKE